MLIHSLRGHSGAVYCIDMDEEGTLAVTGSADRVINQSINQLLKANNQSTNQSIDQVSNHSIAQQQNLVSVGWAA